mgnify:CR=1 FL=1
MFKNFKYTFALDILWFIMAGIIAYIILFSVQNKIDVTYFYTLYLHNRHLNDCVSLLSGSRIRSTFLCVSTNTAKTERNTHTQNNSALRCTI